MLKSRDPLEKVTLNLFKGDKDTLVAFHPTAGWSVAARDIINKYCNQLREQEEEQLELREVTVKVPPLPEP